MQAVILVGGEGTRLRPLTSTVPKPVVPLVDRPFIAFMLEWLQGHGIDDVIMSCGFLATTVRNVLGDGSASGIRLRFVEEPDPRGTAGALKFAEPLLDERFLMLNGDVLTDIDLTGQIAQHERTGARATLALVARRGPQRLRPGAPARGPLGARLRGEAQLRPDRHEPDQRGRLRARARDPRAGPAGAQRLDRARGVAAADRRRPLRVPARSATGWTSARPSATCRAPSTSSRATSRRRCARGSATASSRSPTARRSTVERSPRRCSSAARTSPPARTSAASWCSARTCTSVAGIDGRALGDPQRRRDRRASCTPARLHRRGGLPRRRGHAASTAGRCSARA